MASTNQRINKSTPSLYSFYPVINKEKKQNEKINHDSAQIEIYTDGSCLKNPGPGGFGAIILKDGELVKAVSGGKEMTTNNVMELLGAIIGLTYARQLFGTSIPITLYSDSMYVIDGITKYYRFWEADGWTNRKNKEFWWQLIDAKKGLNVSWKWVKAHNGNHYNEQVDQLARNRAIEFSNNQKKKEMIYNVKVVGDGSTGTTKIVYNNQ